jgi:hypothetical protein
MSSPGRFRTLLAKLFAGTGCTLRRHPLPELREVGREWVASNPHR